MSDQGTPPSPPRGSFGGIASGASVRSRSRPSDRPAAGQPPDADAMRAARRRWASGVAVVATRSDADPPAYRGATVTTFTVVSLDPPLVLVCLERETTTARLIAETGVFAVSVLDRTHEALADRFAGFGPLPDARLSGVPYQAADTGCPILSDALAWFDCHLSASHDGGDHLILIGTVIALGRGPDSDDPLLSYDGAYRRLESA